MGDVLYLSKRVGPGSAASQEERVPRSGLLTQLAVGFPSGGGVGLRLLTFPGDRNIFPGKDAAYIDFRGPLSRLLLNVEVKQDQRLRAEWQSSAGAGTALYAPVLAVIE